MDQMGTYSDAQQGADSDTRMDAFNDAPLQRSADSGAHSSSSSSSSSSLTAPGAGMGPGQLRAFLGAEDTSGVPQATPGTPDSPGMPSRSSPEVAGGEARPGQLRAFLGAEDSSGMPHDQPGMPHSQPGMMHERAAPAGREGAAGAGREFQGPAFGGERTHGAPEDAPGAQLPLPEASGLGLGQCPGLAQTPDSAPAEGITPTGVPPGAPASGTLSSVPGSDWGAPGCGVPPVQRPPSPRKDSARLQARLTSRGSHGTRLAEAGDRLADGGASVVYHSGAQNGEVRERGAHGHAHTQSQGQSHNQNNNPNPNHNHSHSHSHNHSQENSSHSHKPSASRVGRILGGAGAKGLAKASAWLRPERIPGALRSRWLLLLVTQALLSVLAAQAVFHWRYSREHHRETKEVRVAVSARARTQICNTTLYPPSSSLSPDKLTVVVHVTTRARLGQLQQVLQRAAMSPAVHSVHVVLDSPLLTAPGLGGSGTPLALPEATLAPVLVHRNPWGVSGASTRYLPREFIRTAATLSIVHAEAGCGRPLLPTSALLDDLLEVSRQHPRAFVGFEPAAHRWDEAKGLWRYLPMARVPAALEEGAQGAEGEGEGERGWVRRSLLPMGRARGAGGGEGGGEGGTGSTGGSGEEEEEEEGEGGEEGEWEGGGGGQPARDAFVAKVVSAEAKVLRGEMNGVSARASSNAEDLSLSSEVVEERGEEGGGAVDFSGFQGFGWEKDYKKRLKQLKKKKKKGKKKGKGAAAEGDAGEGGEKRKKGKRRKKKKTSEEEGGEEGKEGGEGKEGAAGEEGGEAAKAQKTEETSTEGGEGASESGSGDATKGEETKSESEGAGAKSEVAGSTGEGAGGKTGGGEGKSEGQEESGTAEVVDDGSGEPGRRLLSSHPHSHSHSDVSSDYGPGVAPRGEEGAPAAGRRLLQLASDDYGETGDAGAGEGGEGAGDGEGGAEGSAGGADSRARTEVVGAGTEAGGLRSGSHSGGSLAHPSGGTDWEGGEREGGRERERGSRRGRGGRYRDGQGEEEGVLGERGRRRKTRGREREGEEGVGRGRSSNSHTRYSNEYGTDRYTRGRARDRGSVRGKGRGNLGDEEGEAAAYRKPKRGRNKKKYKKPPRGRSRHYNDERGVYSDRQGGRSDTRERGSDTKGHLYSDTQRGAGNAKSQGAASWFEDEEGKGGEHGTASSGKLNQVTSHSAQGTSEPSPVTSRSAAADPAGGARTSTGTTPDASWFDDVEVVGHAGVGTKEGVPGAHHRSTGTGPGMGAGAGANTDTGTGTGAGEGAGAGAGADGVEEAAEEGEAKAEGTGSNLKPPTAPDALQPNATRSSTGAEQVEGGAGAETGAGAGAETGAGAGAETGAGAGAETGAGVEAGSEAGAGVGAGEGARGLKPKRLNWFQKLKLIRQGVLFPRTTPQSQPQSQNQSQSQSQDQSQDQAQLLAKPQPQEEGDGGSAAKGEGHDAGGGGNGVGEGATATSESGSGSGSDNDKGTSAASGSESGNGEGTGTATERESDNKEGTPRAGEAGTHGDQETVGKDHKAAVGLAGTGGQGRPKDIPTQPDVELPLAGAKGTPGSGSSTDAQGAYPGTPAADQKGGDAGSSARGAATAGTPGAREGATRGLPGTGAQAGAGTGGEEGGRAVGAAGGVPGADKGAGAGTGAGAGLSHAAGLASGGDWFSEMEVEEEEGAKGKGKGRGKGGGVESERGGGQVRGKEGGSEGQEEAVPAPPLAGADSTASDDNADTSTGSSTAGGDRAGQGAEAEAEEALEEGKPRAGAGVPGVPSAQGAADISGSLDDVSTPELASRPQEGRQASAGEGRGKEDPEGEGGGKASDPGRTGASNESPPVHPGGAGGSPPAAVGLGASETTPSAGAGGAKKASGAPGEVPGEARGFQLDLEEIQGLERGEEGGMGTGAGSGMPWGGRGVPGESSGVPGDPGALSSAELLRLSRGSRRLPGAGAGSSASSDARASAFDQGGVPRDGREGQPGQGEAQGEAGREGAWEEELLGGPQGRTSGAHEVVLQWGPSRGVMKEELLGAVRGQLAAYLRYTCAPRQDLTPPELSHMMALAASGIPVYQTVSVQGGHAGGEQAGSVGVPQGGKGGVAGSWEAARSGQLAGTGGQLAGVGGQLAVVRFLQSPAAGAGRRYSVSPLSLRLPGSLEEANAELAQAGKGAKGGAPSLLGSLVARRGASGAGYTAAERVGRLERVDRVDDQFTLVGGAVVLLPTQLLYSVSCGMPPGVLSWVDRVGTFAADLAANAVLQAGSRLVPAPLAESAQAGPESGGEGGGKRETGSAEGVRGRMMVGEATPETQDAPLSLGGEADGDRGGSKEPQQQDGKGVGGPPLKPSVGSRQEGAAAASRPPARPRPSAEFLLAHLSQAHSWNASESARRAAGRQRELLDAAFRTADAALDADGGLRETQQLSGGYGMIGVLQRLSSTLSGLSATSAGAPADSASQGMLPALAETWSLEAAAAAAGALTAGAGAQGTPPAHQVRARGGRKKGLGELGGTTLRLLEHEGVLGGAQGTPGVGGGSGEQSGATAGGSLKSAASFLKATGAGEVAQPAALRQAVLLPPPPREAFAMCAVSLGEVEMALVAAQSLMSSGTARRPTLLLLPNCTRLAPAFRDPRVRRFFSAAVAVPQLWHPYLETSYSLLAAWALTDYDKVVYLSPRSLVTDSLDTLFDRPPLAAAPVPGAPHRFSADVMVLRPALATFTAMVAEMVGSPSLDGTVQGFLNVFFASWQTLPPAHHLPFRFAASYHFPATSFLFPGSFSFARAHEILGPLAVVTFPESGCHPGENVTETSSSLPGRKFPLPAAAEAAVASGSGTEKQAGDGPGDSEGQEEGEGGAGARTGAPLAFQEASSEILGSCQEVLAQSVWARVWGRLRGQLKTSGWLPLPVSGQASFCAQCSAVTTAYPATAKVKDLRLTRTRAKWILAHKARDTGGAWLWDPNHAPGMELWEPTPPPLAPPLTCQAPPAPKPYSDADADPDAGSDMGTGAEIEGGMGGANEEGGTHTQGERNVTLGKARSQEAEGDDVIASGGDVSKGASEGAQGGGVGEARPPPPAPAGDEEEGQRTYAVVTAAWDEATLVAASVLHASFQAVKRGMIVRGAPGAAPTPVSFVVMVSRDIRWAVRRAHEGVFGSSNMKAFPRIQASRGGRTLKLPPQFFILRAWQLGFSKVLFLHPLSLLRRPCAHLFTLPLPHGSDTVTGVGAGGGAGTGAGEGAGAPNFTAVAASFPPDRFSSRLMLITPSSATQEKLFAALKSPRFPTASMDSFLNAFFSDWPRLPHEWRLPASSSADLAFWPQQSQGLESWVSMKMSPQVPPWEQDYTKWGHHNAWEVSVLWRRLYCQSDAGHVFFVCQKGMLVGRRQEKLTSSGRTKSDS